MKKPHNFAVLAVFLVGAFFSDRGFAQTILDRTTIPFINQHMVQPGHTWATYQGVAKALTSTDRDVRFFAVQAGLQLAVFRQQALDIAISDADVGILNLGLAALEREYQQRYSSRLVEIVLSGKTAGLPAAILLLKNDLAHVALAFENLFRRGGAAVRERLLAEIRRGRIVISTEALLALCEVMSMREKIAVLTYLAAGLQGEKCAAEFARWSADQQKNFAQAVQLDEQTAAEPNMVYLLGQFREAASETIFRTALLAAKNSGLRQRLADEMLAARDMPRARSVAGALIAFGGKTDQVLEYAQAVVLIDRYAIGEKLLETWSGQRDKNMAELVSSLQETTDGGTVRTIGRLRENARALQHVEKEQETLRKDVRNFLQSPGSMLLKKNLAGYLASMRLSFE